MAQFLSVCIILRILLDADPEVYTVSMSPLSLTFRSRSQAEGLTTNQPIHVEPNYYIVYAYGRRLCSNWVRHEFVGWLFWV